jgi:hypothetical protein
MEQQNTRLFLITSFIVQTLNNQSWGGRACITAAAATVIAPATSNKENYGCGSCCAESPVKNLAFVWLCVLFFGS